MCEFRAQGYGFETAFSCIEATSIAHTRPTHRGRENLHVRQQGGLA
jgi:hypothetical protein